MNARIELIFMLASIMMMCIMFITIYGYRKERGLRYLLGVLACRIVYAIGVLLEKNSTELADMLVFRNMHQTALNMMVPFFVLFTLELIGRDKLLSLWWRVAFILAFALWSLLMWSTSNPSLIYRTIAVMDGHLVTTRTMYSITFSIVCYSIVAICFYFLFQYIRNIRDDLRKPIMWVLFFASFTVVFEILRFLNPDWSRWLNSLTVYCGFIGMLMLVIMLRYKFFSIVPFARNMVLDMLQESILIANASGHIIDSNHQASHWFSKRGHASISGQNIEGLLAQWPQWLALCKNMQQGRVEIEVWLEGEREIYSVHTYPLHTQRKHGQGSISLIFDITEKQKHLEQISQLNQMKDQLFTIVSHDIRSPLAMQHQLVELLEEGRNQFHPDYREIIEKLGGQTRNTLGMTNNLLEWFRAQREDMVLRPQLLELSEVVEECCYMQRIQMETKQIVMSKHITIGTVVYADREALGLIIRNLLSNAIKFSRVGGSIQFDALPIEDRVMISVRDHGVGMEEEQVRQLFSGQELQSLSGTMGEKGTGLGLLVSRQFAERSGGNLWVESSLGQGCVVYFTVRSGVA
jgi:signal transduction histidine kinase